MTTASLSTIAVEVILFLLLLLFMPAARSSGQQAAAAKDGPVSILTGASDPDTIFGGIKKSAAGASASSQWWQLDHQARASLKKGDLADAERLWRQAVSQAESSSALVPGVVNCLCGLSLLNQRQGHVAESERLYELAMRTLEGLSGRDSEDFARFIPDLAWLYNQHGKPDKAEPILKHAMAVTESRCGQFSLPHARSLEQYAAFLDSNQRHGEASLCRTRAAVIRDRLGSQSQSAGDEY